MTQKYWCDHATFRQRGCAAERIRVTKSSKERKETPGSYIEVRHEVSGLTNSYREVPSLRLIS